MMKRCSKMLAFCLLVGTLQPLFAQTKTQLREDAGSKEAAEDELPRSPLSPLFDLDENLRRRIPQPLINDLEILRQRMQAAVKGPTLGVRIQPLSPQLASHLGISTGVFVEAVMGGTSAARAKLREGDVIVRLGGKKVDGAMRLKELVAEQAGESVSLLIYRGGKRQELTVALPASESAERTAPTDATTPSTPSPKKRPEASGEADEEGESQSLSHLLDEMLQSDLEEMSKAIENEVGKDRMERMRKRLRALLDGRGETPAGPKPPAVDQDQGTLEAIRNELKKMRKEIESLRRRLDDSEQKATSTADGASL